MTNDEIMMTSDFLNAHRSRFVIWAFGISSTFSIRASSLFADPARNRNREEVRQNAKPTLKLGKEK